MDDACGMSVGESLGDLGEECLRLGPAVWPVGREPLPQRRSVDVFEGQIRGPISDAVAEDLDHVA
ncbi:MAG: hypothetical protein ABSE70_11955 [Candidatus Limnocylindrales bacterium]